MGLFSKKTTDKPIKPIIKELFKPSDTFLTFNPYIMVEIALFQDYFTMRAPYTNNKTVYSINYSQVTDVFYGIEKEILKREKSPIGRAIAGGVLFGGVGAVVGAVSGIGEKSTTKYNSKLIISYTSSEGDEKFLPFDDTRQFLGRKLSNKLIELSGLNKTTPSEILGNVSL